MPRDPEREHWAQVGVRLRELLHYQEWDTYADQLHALESDYLERLAVADRDWRYLQGRLQGVRDALDLPQRLIEQGKRAQDG